MDEADSTHTVGLRLTIPAGAATVGARANAVLGIRNGASLALDGR